MINHLQWRVYGNLAIPMQHVDRIEERYFLEIDNMFKIPAHNDVTFRDGGQSHMQGIIIPCFGKNAFCNICLLQLKRIRFNLQQLRYGKNLLKKFVHLFGSNRKFLVHYFGDAQSVFSVTYQIEKSLAPVCTG